jgi:hypothetical protein
MSKHTPGPWVEDCAIISSDGYIIAETVHASAVEEAANLRLIAAAPDLLAALELLAKSTSMAGTPMADVDMFEVAAIVNAALAKAVGDE